MKRRAWLGAMAIAAAAIVAGAVLQGGAESPAAPGAEGPGPTERLLLGVEGVTCGSCESRIRAALEARPGVRAVAVDLGERTVTVEYAAGADDPKSLADAVSRIGYTARYLASGPGVAPAPSAGARPRGGCGGNCCAGG